MAVRTEIVLDYMLKSTWFSFWCRAARCGVCVYKNTRAYRDKSLQQPFVFIG